MKPSPIMIGLLSDTMPKTSSRFTQGYSFLPTGIAGSKSGVTEAIVSHEIQDPFGMAISEGSASAADCWQDGIDRLLSQNHGPEKAQ